MGQLYQVNDLDPDTIPVGDGLGDPLLLENPCDKKTAICQGVIRLLLQMFIYILNISKAQALQFYTHDSESD